MANFTAVEKLLREATGTIFPAAQLVVVDGFRVVLDRAVGEATEQTLFDIASLTKPLSTVTLTMLLVDRGQLSLNGQVRPGMTIRQLLSHSSGLPAWKQLSAGPDSASVREGIVEAARREPLETPPGTHASYSDLGFILLGDALEHATGRRLDALFADEVARQLGLGTTFRPSDRSRCAPAEGLRGIVHDQNARAMEGVAGHAGLFSTAEDVSLLGDALMAAWRDADPALVSGKRPRVVEPRTVRTFWSPSEVPDSTWCLGWDRPSLVGSSAGERWPRDGVGHLGFTGCSMWLDPRRARSVVLLSNRVEPTRQNDRIKAFRPILHDAISEALDG